MKRIALLAAIVLTIAGCKEKGPDILVPFKYKLGGIEIMQMTDVEANVGTRILKTPNPSLYAGIMPYPGDVNAICSFLVKSKEMKYLFDSGMGDMLSENLHKYDESYKSIETIFLTHMHMDHIGGLVLSKQVRAFPNAKIYVSKKEFEYWTNDENLEANPNRRTQFLKARQIAELYKDRITLIEPASFADGGTALNSHVTAFDAPGHTPGHTVYMIESEGKKILIWGDVTHLTQIQVAFPEVSTIYDTDPAQAARSRLAVLEYASKNNALVAGMHILYPGMGHITEKNGKYTFVPVKAPKRAFSLLTQ